MSAKRNRYREKICEFVGVADPDRAIQVLVDRHREPAFGLRAIAANLGVSRIIEEPMLIDGAVQVDGQHRFAIVLNSRCGPARRKFTLAHEVAHLILSDIVRQRSACSRVKALETACDAIAIELLMPAEETVRFVRLQGSPSPEKLREIAQAFTVSLRAAARRIHEDLKIWKEKIGMWHYEVSARELWFVGTRPWRTLCPPFRVFEDAANSKNPVYARETYWEDGGVKPVSLELMNLGRQQILGLVA